MSKQSIGNKLIHDYRLVVADTIVKSSLIFAFGSIVVSVMYLLLMTSRMPSQVPLYYSLPWGSERLAETLWLLYIPAVSFMFFIVAVIISILYYSIEPLLSRLIATTAGFVSFLGAYTLIRIILLVT